MASVLYKTHLQGIMGVVFNKTYQRLGKPEYNYHNSLWAHLTEGIGHCSVHEHNTVTPFDLESTP